MYILLAILIFGFLIFIHELGHFLAAKRMGVQVNEFSICMGPVLWKKTKGETTYSIRAIPIGGFCAMEGEDELSENSRAFNSVKWWRRLIILAAGSFMNLVAGFLILVCLCAALPGFSQARFDSFFEGNTAQTDQGLREGDVLYEIDGERVYIRSDFEMLTARNATGVYDLVVVRDGEKVNLPNFELKKQYFELEGETVLKYGFSFTLVPKNVGSVVREAWYTALDFGRLVRLGLQDLFTGKVSLRDMSGPVGIVSVISETGNSAETTGQGVMNVFNLAAFIAINLAVMNLLPIPALDGGRIVCLLLTTAVEAVIHRKIDPKYEGYLHAAGMILLLGFMALISFSDIFKLFAG